MSSENVNLQDVHESGRMEAFSDGVFAIAITLLVLEIRLPSIADADQPGHLLTHLLELWPVYLAYVTSFASIGIMWINHHTMFKLIRRVDRGILILNGLLLMAITFLNFPTVITAEYLLKPDATVAAAFYSATMIVIAFLFNGLWWYGSFHRHLLADQIDPAVIRTIAGRYAVGCSLYVVTLALAFVNAPLSLAVTLGLAIFFALPLRFLNRPAQATGA